ncbi:MULTISPECIES: hypothetical protein [Clostridium]|uniref:hypothetical protein n=1 Tax=Clostridium TaxID=1485 RepID=UPI0012FDC160|nr:MULTISPECIES: hypothetical protein [Clostridium]
MEKLTPKELGLWTYMMIQKRRKKIKQIKLRGNMEARQVLIESSIKARNRNYKSSRR